MLAARRSILLGGLDVDALAWRQVVRAAGADVSGLQMGKVSALIRSLKASGVWASLDRLWLFASENSTQALIDLRARATATAVNSPAFTANSGYTGNGTTAYINSNFNPSIGGSSYTQNSAYYGFWCFSDPGTTSSFREMGNDDANWGEIQYPSSGAINAGIHQGANPIIVTPSARTGMIVTERTGSAVQTLYRNGAVIATGTAASIAIANNNFNILASNSPNAPTNSGLSCAVLGGALQASGQAALNAALRVYMTAKGLP